jgi:hypothetical protein
LAVATDVTVHVTTATRTVALHALCACIHVLSTTTRGKTISAADSYFAALLVAVTLHLCSEEDAESRRLGLLVPERLLSQAPQVVFPPRMCPQWSGR